MTIRKIDSVGELIGILGCYVLGLLIIVGFSLSIIYLAARLIRIAWVKG